MTAWACGPCHAHAEGMTQKGDTHTSALAAIALHSCSAIVWALHCSDLWKVTFYRTRKYRLLQVLHHEGNLYLCNENNWKFLLGCGMRCTASRRRILQLLGTYTVPATISNDKCSLAERYYIIHVTFLVTHFTTL